MLDHFWRGGPGVQQNNFRCYRCRSIHRCAGIGGRPAGQGAAARLWSVATNWTGCYVNGGVGYGLSNRDHFSFDETGFVNRDGTSGARGYLGRVGGGCDYQFSPAGGWATGSSARSPDYDFMDLHGRQPSPLLHHTKKIVCGGRRPDRIFDRAPSPDLCERCLDLNAVQ